MKKIVYLLGLLLVILSSCSEDDDFLIEGEYKKPFNESIAPQSQQYEIVKLYSAVMRKEIPYPFSAYVLQIENGHYFYMLRYHYNQDLHVGDKISFSVFSYCPNEIAVINGCNLGDGSDAPRGNNNISAGEYWIASDPIEATVKETFSMKIRYSLTFWPIETLFIETTNGELLFVKKSKIKEELNQGDKFVYSAYTLFPNEILALKKL